MSGEPRVVDLDRAVAAVQDLLEALGFDLIADGLERTPRRVVDFAASAYPSVPSDLAMPDRARVPAGGVGAVALASIPFSSVCEHHLLPFEGTVRVVLVPARWTVGLGHVTELVRRAAARLQLQERLTVDLAEVLHRDLAAEAVLVRVTARHSCLWARGSGDSRTELTTEAYRGAQDPAVRMETVQLLLSPGS